MDNLNEIMDIEFCYCGRPYCDFFNASSGEYGKSMSIDEVKDILKDLSPKNVAKMRTHLKSEIKKFNKKYKGVTVKMRQEAFLQEMGILVNTLKTK